MSEPRKYRSLTAQQKTEVVLASLRGQKTFAEICREHDRPILDAGRTGAGHLLRLGPARLAGALARDTIPLDDLDGRHLGTARLERVGR